LSAWEKDLLDSSTTLGVGSLNSPLGDRSHNWEATGPPNTSATVHLRGRRQALKPSNSVKPQDFARPTGETNRVYSTSADSLAYASNTARGVGSESCELDGGCINLGYR